MVLISSKKYACETCIKGHRSSACKHTDRPLFEIKKKGRPVTQCEHCRELRKTKQVHVKCICEAKEPASPTEPNDPTNPNSPSTNSPSATNSTSAPKKKGTPTLPAHAAFPHGVPAALVAVEGHSSSDSDHGGSAHGQGCTCIARDGACHCCTPRKRAPRRRSNSNANANSPNPNSVANNTQSNNNPSSSSSSPTLPPAPAPRAPSHHILARIAELRPVLPRPSARDVLRTQQQHDLFHGHALALPHHEHFSPYGRAHDYAVGAGTSGDFYMHDAAALSAESVRSSASQRSGLSHASAGKGQAGQKTQSTKSASQKSHSTSPSYDGSNPQGFFGAAQQQHPMEWRLPPSLARSEPAGSAFTQRPRSTDDDTSSPYEYDYEYDYDSGYPPPPPHSDSYPEEASPLPQTKHTRPRSEGEAAYPPLRPRSDEGFTALNPSAGVGPNGGIRTCGCGDGCECPGCSLHGHHSQDGPQDKRQRQASCAAAACGGACLDCTILSLPDFAAVVGFGDTNVNGSGGAGGGYANASDGENGEGSGLVNANSNGGGEYERLELDLDLELELEGLDGQGQEYNGGGGGFGTLDERAIDEWIREVGALPPPHSPVPPFEFGGDVHFGEGFSSGDAPQQQFGGDTQLPGDSQFSGSEQQQFSGGDAPFGQPWMFAVAPGTPAPAPMAGLSPATTSIPIGDGVRFLMVPGPGPLRSRSSSSASSEVSSDRLGLGIGGGGASGAGNGAGGGGGGLAGVGLAGLSLDARPGSSNANPHGSGQETSEQLAGFAPPAYMDEPMLFY